ncbi:HAD family hydrolase [Pedobacter cryoconitis]|uniref:Putative hydrolase of the HAD superfamily n=1 Tax=Pedobacter cryoconitis TaxID=188932 RepID=A0A7X0J811_9SPHI|nr:HAD-IA family hydrolase [Pedobacter cryoconitis]MBB6501537.1 putative hydrolase of the HAD superfamily [Pedobacter cryoconitis]
MENSQPKILFFDIGGVLLTNGWGHDSRKLAAEKFGLNYDELNTLHNYIFNVFEIGNITLDEYLETVIFNHPRDFTMEDFKEFVYSRSKELPGLLQWMKEWKRDCGFRVISINNEGKELNTYRVKKFKLHECFDAFISSCDVKMRKPDPNIFLLALGIAQAKPDQCYYFDDRLFQVETAKNLGMHAFHHTSFEETKAILEKIKEEIAQGS